MSTPVKKGSAEKSDGYRPYKVFRQGFLLIHPPRSSMSRKKLTRYWFVLFEQKDLLAFLFFLDEDHYLERKKNEGFFRIDDATSVDVLPDYMGRKNAMCITTPRNKYVLVSESRYELHGWIFALHNAMDEFKKNSLHKKKKISTGNRPRSTSTSGTTIVTTPTASGSGNGPSKSLPRIKPSRPAPPVPQSKKKSDSEISATSNDKQESTSPAHSANNDQDEQSLVIPKVATTSSLDVLVAGLLAETKDLDTLQFNMIEEEPENDSNLANGTAVNFISMQTSQNNEQHKEDYQSSDNQESEHNSQDEHSKNFSESYEDLGGGRNTVPLDNRSRKKSTKKRLSMKGPRSVSPPNIPPPPPPVVVTSEGQDEENSHQVRILTTNNDNQDDGGDTTDDSDETQPDGIFVETQI